MRNQYPNGEFTLEALCRHIFTHSQDIDFYLNDIERYKLAFEQLLLEPCYKSWLRQHAITRNLYYTKGIKGNTLREGQVSGVLEGEKTQANMKKVLEIKNCYKAYQFIDSMSDNPEIPIDEQAIRYMNSLFLGDDDPKMTPGQYRTEGEIWIGHYVSNNVYIPPKHEDVPALMHEFVNWLRHEHRDTHPILIAGIAHMRLVQIHPFWEGNGRTARALATLVLQRQGYGFNKLLSLEGYFSLDFSNYREAISRTVGDNLESQPDMTLWLEYFGKSLAIEISLVSDDVLNFRVLRGRRWATCH